MSHSAMSQTDPVHSGAGVFYQAVPGIGADGKNIMKLIPVQKVNGQFFRSESRPNMNPAAHKFRPTVKTVSSPAQMVTKPVLTPAASLTFVKKKDSLIDVVPHQEGLDLSLNKQNIHLMAVVPPMTTPAVSGGKSGRAPSHLPVTEDLQGPSNAPGRTVPKSELCPAVKTQILTSSAGSTPGPSSPRPQSDSDLQPLTMFWKTFNKTSYGPQSEDQKLHLVLIPKISQRPNSPIKWVVQGDDSPTVATPDPDLYPDPIHTSVHTALHATEILQAVAKREHNRNIVTKPVHRARRNTSVIYNGPKKLVFKEEGDSLAPTPDPDVNTCVTSEILQAVAKREHNRNNITKPVHRACRENTSVIYNGPKKLVIKEEDYSLSPTPDPDVNTCVTSEILQAVAEREHNRKHCDIIKKPVRNSPKKWVFREEDNSLAPTVDHINSSVASEILRVLAQREKNRKRRDTVKKSVSQTRKKNTSVKCNNPKKCVKEQDTSPVLAVDPINSTVASEILRVVAQREHAKQHREVITKLVSKISQAKNGPRQDSTRVMSNSPRKCVKEEDDSVAPAVDHIEPSVTSEILRVVAERENARRFEDTKPISEVQKNTVVVCSSRVIGCTQPSKMGHNDSPAAARKGSESKKTDVLQRSPELRGKSSEESGEMIDLCDDEATSVRRSAGTRPDEENVVFVSHVPPKSVSEPTQGLGRPSSRTGWSLTEEDAHTAQISMNPVTSRISCQIDENLQRQKFGITAEVKICLQRVDEPSLRSEPVQSESMRSVVDLQVPLSGLKEKELFLQNRHTDIILTENFRLNTKCLSVLRDPSCSLRETSCQDAEPVVAYMEPIEDDFLSTDEKPQSRTCVDQNTNTRRMGRTRKRPACPCCMPGTQHLAAKSSNRSKVLGRWSHGKVGRTKSNVKTQWCPVTDSGSGLPRSSMDSEELDLHGEIRRLKELLKEKELALQLMRNSTS